MGDRIMASIIRATTTSGLQVAPDNSGSLELQTNGTTTAITIDTSQRAAFVAGTAAAPAITTAGDTNTGMWFPTADTIAASTGGSERMRIDSSGNVLIGTTSGFNTASNRGNISLNGSTDSVFSFGNGGSSSGYIYSYSTGLEITTVGSRNLVFQTSNTERMRIDSSGNLLVGTTSNSSVSSKLHVSSSNFVVSINGTNTSGESIRFYSNGSTAGTISYAASSVAYNTSSDYRLKENVEPMQNALSVVQQLKPVTYTWKRDGSAGQGFIAHELQALVPDCVTGEKDAVDKEGNPEYQGVDTSFLVATLTAAIQEQQTIINDLKARIEALEAK
jgi:hypothetical protein